MSLQKKLLDKGGKWEEIAELDDKSLETKSRGPKEILPHGWMQKIKKKLPTTIMNQTTFTDIENINDPAQFMLYDNKLPKELRGSNVDKKIIVAKVMEKLAIKRPPKSWWKDTHDSVSRKNKGLAKESVDKIVGDLWYNSMDGTSRSKAKKEHKD